MMAILPKKDEKRVKGRFPGASFLLALFAVLIYFIPSGAELLEYRRDALEHGELWRLVTCHFTHYSFEHLAWDVAAFMILGAMCERRNRKGFLLCVILSGLLIPSALWIAKPKLFFYMGLSGLDSALFGLLATGLLLESREKKDLGFGALVLLLMLLFGGKVAYESLQGSALFVNGMKDAVAPVPLAHGLGAAMGGLLALWFRSVPRSSLKPNGLIPESSRVKT